MLHVTKSITINQSPEIVYRFWRNFSNLPQFMAHVLRVDLKGDGLSHWVVAAPAGQTVEWDAEVVDIRHEGFVRFERAPADRGTEVHVDLRYDAPAGQAGAAIAKLFGEELAQQIGDDLRRFKQVMETGEVVRSDGTLEGAGQGTWQQRAAQAPDAEVER